MDVNMCECKPESSFINNPNQLEIPDLETRYDFREKYLDGLNTGLNWDGNYIPGGPWVYNGRNDEMRVKSNLEYEYWMKGFHEGLAKRLATNAHFAEWWNRNRGKQMYFKGVTIDEVRYKDPENTNVQ